MEFFEGLLEEIFDHEQAGGTTMWVDIMMTSPTHCGKVTRHSTCGGDTTTVVFRPPLPWKKALLEAQEYIEKGTFTHGT